MSTILDTILVARRVRLAEAMVDRPLPMVRQEARLRRANASRHTLRAALSRSDRVNVIAEIKRASPSAGAIRPELMPSKAAQTYFEAGAAAVSVLTEVDHFRGSLDDLRLVRSAVPLPVLSKDFFFDEYQVYEAAAAGADAVLLIAAMLDDNALRHLRAVAEEQLGMDALVEVHTAEEMSRASAAGATLIGVNNRDLKTFEVSLQTSIDLAVQAPPSALLVSESGLRTGADLRQLRAAGYAAFLIGETLMRAENPGEVLRRMLREAATPRVRVKVCGITTIEDAITSANAGADMLGFNFYPGSRRYVRPQQARNIIRQLPGSVIPVGVFVNEDADVIRAIAQETGISVLQLHGQETPQDCDELRGFTVIKALPAGPEFSVEQARRYQVAHIMLDAFSRTTPGGTGRAVDWNVARRLCDAIPRVFLAGGLSPDNVTQAIATARPFAVDACSRLECVPGRKDLERVRAFVRAVRAAESRTPPAATTS